MEMVLSIVVGPVIKIARDLDNNRGLNPSYYSNRVFSI
jgi:hypothetical protein